MSEIRILDIHGNEQSTEWLELNFGALIVRSAPEPGPRWKLFELQEREGQAILLATLYREDPTPVGVKVARVWGPDILNGDLASEGLVDLPDELATHFERGVFGPAEGDPTGGIAAIGYGIGRGDAYKIAENGIGASAIWVEGNSDCIIGLGWSLVRPDGTLTQYRTLEPRFVWSDEDPGPSPGPGDEFEQAAEAMETIAAGWSALAGVIRSLGSE